MNMVTNERQFRITKSQLAKLRAAAADFDIAEANKRLGSPILARAELGALESEIEALSAQLRDYEALKSGAVRVLQAENLSELPGILIRARIAQGLSQRELAQMLGLKEQQIQRYEAEGYATASFRRLSEVAAALKLSLQTVGSALARV